MFAHERWEQNWARGYETAEESAEAGAQKRLILEARRLAPWYREVFGTIEGRAVLADILKRCGYFDPGIRGDEHPNATIARAGARNVAVYILSQLAFSEAEIIKLTEQRANETLRVNEGVAA